VFVSNSGPFNDAFDPRTLYRTAFEGGDVKNLTFSRRAFETSTSFARQRIQKAAAEAGATVIDPLSTLCTGDVCPVTDGATPLFMDRAHYRGSRITDPRFGFMDPAVFGGGSISPVAAIHANPGG
jgi:hypothetical protein